jgi:hypothetical protein
MKRFLKNLTISLLLIFPSIISFSQIPLNWTRDEINPGEDFTLSPDESFFTEGLESCHLQLNSSAVPYLKSDVFYVTPGANYEFSFDVFDNDTAGQVKVYADFYDTYGFNIFGQPPVFSSDSADWQTISWDGVVPGQAVVGYVLIKFYSQPDLYTFTKTAHVWMDNIQFRQAGGDNLLANGGFEEWVVGVKEIDNDREEISIYPNPARVFIYIDLPGKAEVIIISDLSGREVLKLNACGKEQLPADIRQLPEGLYIIKAILENNSVLTGKLLIR